MLSAAYTHHLDGLLDFREFDLIRQKAVRDKDEAAERLPQKYFLSLTRRGRRSV
jgi:hypothetical protein